MHQKIIAHALPLYPPVDPLHRYTLGKMGSKLRSHPLQTRYKAVTGGVTLNAVIRLIQWPVGVFDERVLVMPELRQALVA